VAQAHQVKGITVGAAARGLVCLLHRPALAVVERGRSVKMLLFLQALKEKAVTGALV
jgi:hypothetical protein